MRVFVASSWRNQHHSEVVSALRSDGHTVFDFTDLGGFNWRLVSGGWEGWSAEDYVQGLREPTVVRAYERDMKALRECDACVYVMPCGASASLEAGWACGAGKIVIAYIPAMNEPELMLLMAHLITTDLAEVRTRLKDAAQPAAHT